MIALFALLPMLAFAVPDEKTLCRRIENHLIIHDTAQAIQEAERAALENPDSLALREGLIKAYARGGEEQKTLLAFSEWKKRHPEKVPRRIYEEICWGLIEKAEKSSSPLIRTMSILAAYWGQDARGVKLIERRLYDNNTLVRQAAAEVAGRMQDERIQRAVARRLTEELDWDTRLELLRAAGSMKIKAIKPLLLETIADPRSSIEERLVSTEALLRMLDYVPRDELLALSQSDRVGLRALSAEIITFLAEKESTDILWQLAQDERAEVRGQAVLGLGVLRVQDDTKFIALLDDREFHVGLAAAYALLLSGSDQAHSWVKKALVEEKPEKARLVAAMLGSTGVYGTNLARGVLPEAKDFYVRMNLALALVNGPDSDSALDILYDGLTQNKERWSRERKGVFSVLKPSQERHRPLFPNWPELVNKETRLEIFNLLAIKEHPRALAATREFLKDKGWGISGMTSALLLTEGEEKEIELIRPLLADSDPDIRLQAALILARWDPQEVSVKNLCENYDTLSREKKEIVLQALGAIGDEEAVGFLIKEMSSSHASMRLIAGASLLKCLYE